MSLRRYWERVHASKPAAPALTGVSLFSASGATLDALAAKYRLPSRSVQLEKVYPVSRQDDFYRRHLVETILRDLKGGPTPWHSRLDQYGEALQFPRVDRYANGKNEFDSDYCMRMANELTQWIRTFDNWSGMT